MRHGFDLGYKTWVHHDEPDLPPPPPLINNTRQPQMSDMTALLNDLSYIPPNNEHNETSNEPTQATRNEFKELYASANEELYPGYDYVTRLDFMAKFIYFKVKGYESIHAYEHDCCLFRGDDNKDLDFCLVCNTSRWKDSNTPRNKVLKKVLRYFSIIPRLQHLYKSSHAAKEMIRHATGKCTEPEEMRRLDATGTYTDDEINRLARRGKQRGHIPGVGRVLPARVTAGPCRPAPESTLKSLHKKVDFMMSLFKSDSKFSDAFSQFESAGANGSGGRRRTRMAMTIVSCVIYCNKSEVVLMDSSGRSLITIRRKKLSLTDSWLVYNGETTSNPRFSVTKHVNFLSAKSLAHVSNTGSPPRNNNNKKNIAYEIEGSYAQRSCVVYDNKRRPVAEIKRKEALRGVPFGGDVFRLVVQPEIDPTVAMALVVLLDQMFGGSSRRFQT
nr:protein LURP-one-related 8-like [Tanacetum cinerariifolium]